MKDRKKSSRAKEATRRGRRHLGRFGRHPEREDYSGFELGGGSKLDFDNPDVCHALSMAKREREDRFHSL